MLHPRNVFSSWKQANEAFSFLSDLHHLETLNNEFNQVGEIHEIQSHLNANYASKEDDQINYVKPRLEFRAYFKAAAINYKVAD